MIKTNIATILFGSTEHSITPDDIRNNTHHPLPGWPVPATVIFQHQVHGTQGIAITTDNLAQNRPFLIHDSDYLVTNVPNTGIGVLTADCVPIAIIDHANRAIGMIHAGWRGSVGGIAQNAIAHMAELYGSRPEQLNVYIGPCAHACCYTVNSEFIKQLPAWTTPAVREHCFDLVACNHIALQACGVPIKHINTDHSTCTICNANFNSYRRNAGNPARQPSIIWLN